MLIISGRWIEAEHGKLKKVLNFSAAAKNISVLSAFFSY